MKKLLLIQKRGKSLCGRTLPFIFFYLFVATSVRAQILRGKITDNKNEAVVGASVIVKGAQKGTVTNAEGNFSIQVEKDDKLIISSVGFKKQEINVSGRNTLNIVLLEDIESLEEVIVTGLFDKRSRMESSVAISVLNSKQLAAVIPVSAVDLLKNIPGVYVNSSLGEIRNTVYSRGVSVGSNDGASGYYYVSMQEDGLPITNATFGNYGPDFFLRADATLGKLEAVRGGTASILGNNAPGGIFNYVSKTGGTVFQAEVRAKYGLEGNGKNPFYRTDFNFGGPLNNDKSITYNVGGFWRQSDGARNPGYPMNNGGQIKANIVKKFKGGSVKLYAKYLNDKNAWFEFLPTTGFSHPTLPAGVEQTNSVLIPAIKASFKVNDTNETVNYDSRDKINSKDISFGLNFDKDLGNGFVIDNKMKYSDKSSVWNTTGVVYPTALDNIIFYAILGQIAQFGTYKFNDLATGKNLATVMQLPNMINGQFAGFNFPVLNSSLPGESIQKNSLYFNPLFYTSNKMGEFIDQLTITKRLNKMSFTAGAFYAVSNLTRRNGSAGLAMTTMLTPHPELTSITYDDFAGNTYKLTAPNGAMGSGSSSAINLYDISQKQIALFLGHNWTISDRLDLDWGIRYEGIGIDGTNQIATSSNDGTGGVDKNPLTTYDNATAKVTSVYKYNKSLSTFSMSAGLNYKLADNYAVYGRYSQGNKAPDMGIYIGVDNDASAKFLDPQSQKVQQFELGFKAKTNNLSLFITPFYSILDNVPIQQIGQETDDISSQYAAPILYNKYETKGVELEANYNLTSALSIRGVATLQSSKAVRFQAWLLGANGKADDKIESYSGNETDNNANLIVRISPTYSRGKVYASIDWSYMGKRAANVPNAFYLPAFDQTNLNLGYNLTSKVQLQGNINNVFNQIGVMSWSAPGGFPQALDRQGFTKAQLEANPNAVYSTISIPPRAFFLSINYKF